MKRFKEFLYLLVEASEGDARKYMKKVLEAMGLAEEFAEEYGEHWSEQIFNEIRSKFIHNGCDVYFTPGLARIAYGELDMGTEDEDTDGLRRLGQLVRFITIAHKTDFSRNLEQITTISQGPNKGQKQKSAPFTLDQLNDMFGKVQQQMTDAERAEFNNTQHTNTGYTIIELKDFETAHKYQPYTDLPGGDSWCYLETEETFNNYRNSGNRTYLALAPGFEKLKPGDPGYGRSMIGFDMGPVDENGFSHLEVCNNRYNHAPDLEHENSKTGDNKYNEIELSKILGFPVWEKCPGFTEQELIAAGILTDAEVLRKLESHRDELHAIMRDYAIGNSDKAEIRRKALYDVLIKDNLRYHLITQHDIFIGYEPVESDTIFALKCTITDARSDSMFNMPYEHMFDLIYKIDKDELIIADKAQHSRNCIIHDKHDSVDFYDATKGSDPIYTCTYADFETHFDDSIAKYRFCELKTTNGNTIIYDTKNSNVVVDSNTIAFDKIMNGSKGSIILLNNNEQVMSISGLTLTKKMIRSNESFIHVLQPWANDISKMLVELNQNDNLSYDDIEAELNQYFKNIWRKSKLTVKLGWEYMQDVKNDDDWTYTLLDCKFSNDLNAEEVNTDVYLLFNKNTNEVFFTCDAHVEKSIYKFSYTANKSVRIDKINKK